MNPKPPGLDSPLTIRVFPTSALPRTFAERMAMLWDMYAPEDENGIRRPGEGMITLDELRALMKTPLNSTSPPREPDINEGEADELYINSTGKDY